MKHELTQPRLIAEAEIKKCEAAIYAKTGLNFELQIKRTSVDNKTPLQLLQKIADVLDMNVHDYTNGVRKTDWVDLRYLGIYFIKLYFPDWTNCRIGKLYNYHHSSIAVAHQKAVAFIEVKESSFVSKYTVVKEALEQWLMEESV